MNLVEKLHTKVEKGELCFGTHCSTTELEFYEMCGLLGYDYVWIDNEHGGMTLPMIANGIVATNAGGAAAIVRVPGHGVEDVKPVLEMGPQGIIFPMVNTPEAAEICAKHCKYPPKGTRSWGPLRAMNYYEKPMDQYLAEVERDTLCMLQCEHVESVRNLDAILEVPNVDVIIVGPMDLSASIGKLGKLDDPEVVDLINTIIRKCKAANKPFSLSVGTNWELAKYFIENGASYVSMASCYDWISKCSHELLGKVADLRNTL